MNLQGKRAAIVTLGCKVNQYETDAMYGMLKEAGVTMVDPKEAADIYIVNTCSVTNMAERKSRQMLHRAKKKNPDVVVVAVGCYAQVGKEELSKDTNIDLIIGNNKKKDLIHILEEHMGEKESAAESIEVIDIAHDQEYESLHVEQLKEHTRAYIKVQDGCNQFCSYCIIPYARGPVRSRAKDDVVREIKELAHNGFKEIILVGIHVASYGVDLGDTTLESLIMDVDKIDGVERIRLSSIEPMTLNQEFIDSIKDSKKLCHHFHISLQSGCDETLKRMNRKYTTAQFKGIVDGLREAFDDVAITTDIMVGFPDESDEEFNKTVEFVRNIKFADAHVFQYSQRRGTPAAKRPNQISPDVKEKRSKIIIAETQKTRDEFINRFIGKTMRVLFEQPAKDGLFEGKTDNYITVHAPSDIDLNDQFRNVLLERNENGIVIGKIVE